MVLTTLADATAARMLHARAWRLPRAACMHCTAASDGLVVATMSERSRRCTEVGSLTVVAQTWYSFPHNSNQRLATNNSSNASCAAGAFSASPPTVTCAVAPTTGLGVHRVQCCQTDKAVTHTS